jgi:hypothetical protein
MILDDGVFGTLQVLAVLVILFAPFLQGPPKHIQDLRMQRPLFLVRPFLQLLMHFRGQPQEEPDRLFHVDLKR